MSTLSKPHEIVERALELSRADGCVVIADEQSTANLRWAGNTLTTNGVTRGRTLTVIATVDGKEGTASGVVFRMLTPLKRADGQPCETEATWPGWALPQLKAPPSTYVCGPPTALIEPQKSVVVAWYATSRSCPVIRPFSILKKRWPVNWKLKRCMSIDQLLSPTT